MTQTLRGSEIPNEYRRLGRILEIVSRVAGSSLRPETGRRAGRLHARQATLQQPWAGQQGPRQSQGAGHFALETQPNAMFVPPFGVSGREKQVPACTCGASQVAPLVRQL